MRAGTAAEKYTTRAAGTPARYTWQTTPRKGLENEMVNLPYTINTRTMWRLLSPIRPVPRVDRGVVNWLGVG